MLKKGFPQRYAAFPLSHAVWGILQVPAARNRGDFTHRGGLMGSS
jgi:hypothetical protein